MVKFNSEQVVHGLPVSEKDVAEQNFLRGKIAAYEDFIELADELKQWREMHRKRRNQ